MRTAILAVLLAACFANATAEAATLRFDSGLYTTADAAVIPSGGLPTVPYTTSMRTTGTFQVAEAIVGNMSEAPLTLLSFSLFDGLGTLSSPAVPTDTTFRISTDGSGAITGWTFFITNYTGNFDLSGVVLRTFNSTVSRFFTGFTASEALCDPIGSDNTVCAFAALPSYVQAAVVFDVGKQSLAVVAVPLPASSMLMLAGLGALFARARQRRRR